MDRKNSIDDAFIALQNEEYARALEQFRAIEGGKQNFNVQYGLAVCYFQAYQSIADKTDRNMLFLALRHAEAAADLYSAHFDMQLILGQAYATLYFLTRDFNAQEKALKAYDACLSLVFQRPDFDSKTLEERVTELKEETRCQ